MEVKIFWQDKCPNCPAAKDLVRLVMSGSEVSVKEYNINNVDGMAEATFYGVMGTPTTIVVDDDDSEIISWRSQIPDKTQLSEVIQN
ncbi:MAG: thioredoxin family protein [DPANN group archaeon]|nr:thioredoxin family protein [DPANN group archaeon]